MILSLLRSPSSYRDEPVKYARNQIGHMLVVGALPVLLLPLLFGLTLVLYIVWEWWQWKNHDAETYDAFEDMAFVATGAVGVHAGEPLVVICGGIFLASGVLLRRGT